MNSLRIALLFAVILPLQAQTGRIAGRVTDPAAAVVVGAEIVVTEQETGAAYRAVTSASGDYVVPFLPAGHYGLAVCCTRP